MSTQYTIVRTWQNKPFHLKNVHHGWTCSPTGWDLYDYWRMPPHPTLFLRKEVYEKHGLFDASFKIAGDYDFMLRVMTDPEMNLHYPPEVITNMRLGGVRPWKFVRKHFTGPAPAASKAFRLKCRNPDNHV
ncbi:MAG: hypothetical protein K0B11_17235 [Mariniphaga sp.]|nr:hypothetical protein [Mariniphaga sp.]